MTVPSPTKCLSAMFTSPLVRDSKAEDVDIDRQHSRPLDLIYGIALDEPSRSAPPSHVSRQASRQRRLASTSPGSPPLRTATAFTFASLASTDAISFRSRAL